MSKTLWCFVLMVLLLPLAVWLLGRLPPALSPRTLLTDRFKPHPVPPYEVRDLLNYPAFQDAAQQSVRRYYPGQNVPRLNYSIAFLKDDWDRSKDTERRVYRVMYNYPDARRGPSNGIEVLLERSGNTHWKMSWYAFFIGGKFLPR